MTGRDEGFTLVEIAVAIMIGLVLLSFAVRGMGETQSRMAVQNASQNFAALHARARAHAIERGDLVRFNVEPSQDLVTLTMEGDVVERFDFRDALGVDLQAPSSITLCLNPRGFGETGCNSFSSTVEVTFVQGAQSSSVRILPLGQLRW